VQKFYDQSRITSALEQQKEGDTENSKPDQPKQIIVMEEQYLNQQAQRHVFKGIRDELKQRKEMMTQIQDYNYNDKYYRP